MTNEEFENFANIGGTFNTEVEEISLNEIERYKLFTAIIPVQLRKVTHSKQCALLWEAFESVIAKSVNKKYADEARMRQSMNLMLFNELRKRNIDIRKGF